MKCIFHIPTRISFNDIIVTIFAVDGLDALCIQIILFKKEIKLYH